MRFQTRLDHGDKVTAVAIHPTQPLIASGSEDQTIRFWDFQGQAVGQPLEGHGDEVETIAFSPTGELIASGSEDRDIRFVGLVGESCRRTIERAYR